MRAASLAQTLHRVPTSVSTGESGRPAARSPPSSASSTTSCRCL